MDEIKTLLTEIRDELRKINERAEQQAQASGPLSDQANELMQGALNLLKGAENGQ